MAKKNKKQIEPKVLTTEESNAMDKDKAVNVPLAKRTYKITKLSINPIRKINIRNYETIDVNAGIEIVFDKPVDVNDPQVKQAQEDMRKVVGNEMRLQFQAFKPKSKPKPTTNGNG